MPSLHLQNLSSLTLKIKFRENFSSLKKLFFPLTCNDISNFAYVAKNKLRNL